MKAKIKKLSSFLLVSVFTFCGCSDENDEVKGGDDNKEGGNEKEEVVINSEDQLTGSEGGSISASTEISGYYFKDTFTGPESYVTFDHYYSDWGQGYSFTGFTYTNKTSHFQNYQPNCGNIKTGEIYLGVYSDENTIAPMAIIDSQYSIKDLWITTSKSAYISVTEGDNYTRPFKKGGWYEVTMTKYDNEGKKITETRIKLADYKTDTDKPVNTWIWFDLTPPEDASKITLIPSFSDSDEFGVNAGKYFCIDDLILIEK